MEDRKKRCIRISASPEAGNGSGPLGLLGCRHETRTHLNYDLNEHFIGTISEYFSGENDRNCSVAYWPLIRIHNRILAFDKFIEFFQVDPHYFERTFLLIPDNSAKSS